jgi:hypothetical protein
MFRVGRSIVYDTFFAIVATIQTRPILRVSREPFAICDYVDFQVTFGWCSTLYAVMATSLKVESHVKFGPSISSGDVSGGHGTFETQSTSCSPRP